MICPPSPGWSLTGWIWREAFGFSWAIGDTRLHVARALDGGGHDGAFAARYGRSF